MAASVSVTGLDRAERMLRRVGARGADQSATFAREAARVQRSIGGVPVDTGRLRSSVAGGAETLREVGPDGYTVGSHVPYARFVFGGTRYVRARPPKVPGSPASSAARAVNDDLRRA
jgi:hypothetical protein